MSKDLFGERTHRLGCMKIYLRLTRLCDVRVKLLRERERKRETERKTENSEWIIRVESYIIAVNLYNPCIHP